MKVRDQCGVCGGDGKSCLDCAGAVNGGELGDDGDCAMADCESLMKIHL